MKHTKEALRSYNQYLKSNMHSIFEAYENPSYNKQTAWTYCQKLCKEFNGYNLKIISKNSFQFTAGFEFVNNSGIFCFCLITRGSDRYYEIPESEV